MLLFQTSNHFPKKSVPQKVEFSRFEIIAYFLICLVRTSSYLYYIDNFKYLALNFISNDKTISLVYGVMSLPDMLMKILSGYIFTYLNLKKSTILNFSMIIFYEILLYNFVRGTETVFFAVFMWIRFSVAFTQFLNFLTPYSLWGTIGAIEKVGTFENYYWLSVLLYCVLNYFLFEDGNLYPIIWFFLSCEVSLFFVLLFFIKDRVLPNKKK